jgi:ATP-binding cassette subfamily F protein 3
MAQLQKDQAALEARLATALPPAEIAQAGQRLKAVMAELGELEERWLALSGDLESFEPQR